LFLGIGEARVPIGLDKDGNAQVLAPHQQIIRKPQKFNLVVVQGVAGPLLTDVAKTKEMQELKNSLYYSDTRVRVEAAARKFIEIAEANYKDYVGGDIDIVFMDDKGVDWTSLKANCPKDVVKFQEILYVLLSGHSLQFRFSAQRSTAVDR
jgi:hypothetical protein